MASEYRHKALNDSWSLDCIKSGDYDDIIQDKEMVLSDNVSDVLVCIDNDIDGILKEISGVKGIDIIDTVRDMLISLAEKVY